MADTKKLLDLNGLALYDSKLKAKIAEDYAKKTDIKETDLSGYATKDEVATATTGLATEAMLDDYLKLTDSFKVQYSSSDDPSAPSIGALDLTLDKHLQTAYNNANSIKKDYQDFKDNMSSFVDTVATKDELSEATKRLATQAEVTSGNEMINASITEVKGSVDTLGGRVQAIEDANYLDQEAAKKIIAEAQHMKKEVVDSLPDVAEGVENVLYLRPATNGDGENIFEEFLLINGKWEKIGDTQTTVDLSNYMTRDEVTEAIGTATGAIVIETISIQEIDQLFA